MKSPSQTHIIIALAGMLIAGLAIGYAIGFDVGWERVTSGGQSRAPQSFEECVMAGNPVMESYPRQCRTQDGRLFVEEIDVPTPPEQTTGRTGDGCARAGCSSQLCVEADGAPPVTTCEFRAEYACYPAANCERQRNGACGWTMDVKLTACLNNPPPLE